MGKRRTPKKSSRGRGREKKAEPPSSPPVAPSHDETSTPQDAKISTLHHQPPPATTLRATNQNCRSGTEICFLYTPKGRSTSLITKTQLERNRYGTRQLKLAKHGTQSFGSRNSNDNNGLTHRNQYVLYFKRGHFVRRTLKERC